MTSENTEARSNIIRCANVSWTTVRTVYQMAFGRCDQADVLVGGARLRIYNVRPLLAALSTQPELIRQSEMLLIHLNEGQSLRSLIDDTQPWLCSSRHPCSKRRASVLRSQASMLPQRTKSLLSIRARSAIPLSISSFLISFFHFSPLIYPSILPSPLLSMLCRYLLLQLLIPHFLLSIALCASSLSNSRKYRIRRVLATYSPLFIFCEMKRVY